MRTTASMGKKEANPDQMKQINQTHHHQHHRVNQNRHRRRRQ